LRPGGCALSALKLALGDIGAFRPTCPMDRAGQIFLIIHDTHPTHTVRREARGHISFSPPRRHFYTILSTPRESYGPNYP
jgi:hypothetical protein